jgi:hypothetical protein
LAAPVTMAVRGMVGGGGTAIMARRVAGKALARKAVSDAG